MRDAGFVDDVLRICLVSTRGDGDVGGDGGWSHVTCRGVSADAATMEEVASEPLLVPMAPPHAAASLLFQLQGDMWWLYGSGSDSDADKMNSWARRLQRLQQPQ